MDQGLFGKYRREINTRKNTINEIIDCIKELTGVVLDPSEIVLKKKTISFQTSSVKKSILQTTKCKEILHQKGFTTIV